MNNEVLIKVENVSRKFCSRTIGNLKRSLWYGVKDIASEMTGRTVDHEELCKASISLKERVFLSRVFLFNIRSANAERIIL